MRLSALSLFFVLSLLPLRAAAQCESDAQCKHGRVCRAGQCTDPGVCAVDVDCPGEEICVARRCAARGEAASASTAPVAPAAKPEADDGRPHGLAAEFGFGVGAGVYAPPSYSALPSFDTRVSLALGGYLRSIALMGLLDAELQYFPYFSGGQLAVLGVTPAVGLRFRFTPRLLLTTGLGTRLNTVQLAGAPTVLLSLFIGLGDSGFGLRIAQRVTVELASRPFVSESTSFGVAFAL